MILFEVIRSGFAVFGLIYTGILLYWHFKIQPRYDRARKELDFASKEQHLWLKYFLTDPQRAKIHQEAANSHWQNYHQIMEGKE